jgi:hypothetical protein
MHMMIGGDELVNGLVVSCLDRKTKGGKGMMVSSRTISRSVLQCRSEVNYMAQERWCYEAVRGITPRCTTAGKADYSDMWWFDMDLVIMDNTWAFFMLVENSSQRCRYVQAHKSNRNGSLMSALGFS